MFKHFTVRSEVLGNCNIDIVPVGHNCVHVDGNTNCAMPTGFTPMTGPVVVRGVRYGVSIHLYKWADGHWHLGEEGGEKPTVFVSRLDYKGEASDSAEKFIVKELTRLVEEWYAKTGDVIFYETEVESVKMGIERVKDEIEKAESVLTSKKFDLSVLQTKLTQWQDEVRAAKRKAKK